MISDAKKRANIEYNRSRDNIMIRPNKSEGSRIRQAAAQADQSVQAYILDTLRVRMDAEGIPETEEKEG